MENNKLFELLTLIGGVNSNKWRDVMKIVELMPFIEVTEKKWVDKHKQRYPENYPLDLSKIKTWSTYDGECIDLVFSNEDNKLICEARIYDGERLNGYRRDLRFTATLIMPDDFIKELEYRILRAFDKFAEYSYEDFLENQKKLWVENFKSQILNK